MATFGKFTGLSGSNKKIVPLVLGAAVLIVIIIGVFAFRGSKQQELSRAFLNLAKAQSFHTNTELELSLPVKLRNQDRPIVGVTSRVSGDVSFQESTPVLTGDLYMEARGRGMILFADGQLRLLPDAVAFHLQNLPALLNPTGSLVEKWTYVNVPTLATTNQSDVKVALANTISGMQYVNKEKAGDSGPSLLHFRREVTPEQEEILTEVFRQGTSGNRGLNIVARLLKTFDIKSLEVWVDPKKETVAQIKAVFKKPSDEADEFRSILTMQFSDYNKSVTVDRPTGQLTVQPEVFAHIFGGAEVAAIQ